MFLGMEWWVWLTMLLITSSTYWMLGWRGSLLALGALVLFFKWKEISAPLKRLLSKKPQIKPLGEPERGDALARGREPTAAAATPPHGWPPDLDGERHLYLHKQTLSQALGDEEILDALLKEKYDGASRTLKNTTLEKRRDALLEAAKSKRDLVHSPWSSMSREDVIA